MKITMKDFKDNAMIGVGTGLIVSGIFYFINKKYVKAVNEINETQVIESEIKLNALKIELNELESENLHE